MAPLGTQAVGFSPPVASFVTDPFRPPQSFAGPGNRGLEYAEADGLPVAASGDGRVAFAGYVGDRAVVSVVHVGGLRTTYTDVTAITVGAGDRVLRGEQVAVAGARFHFGAILAGAYIDPSTLFATAEVPRDPPPARLRLVPARHLGGS